jgi:hypothetical protein
MVARASRVRTERQAGPFCPSCSRWCLPPLTRLVFRSRLHLPMVVYGGWTPGVGCAVPSTAASGISPQQQGQVFSLATVREPLFGIQKSAFGICPLIRLGIIRLILLRFKAKTAGRSADLASEGIIPALLIMRLQCRILIARIMTVGVAHASNLRSPSLGTYFGCCGPLLCRLCFASSCQHFDIFEAGDILSPHVYCRRGRAWHFEGPDLACPRMRQRLKR